nr:MAG TPA: protein of unknown function (DUF5380) [Caudoviricetes sp.]
MTNGWIIDVSKSVGSGVSNPIPGLAEYWFY